MYEFPLRYLLSLLLDLEAVFASDGVSVVRHHGIGAERLQSTAQAPVRQNLP